ncbi:nitrate- and nitrite sensing domain-containing protein [Streptomyces sp. ISL-100]|uniref:sensor histidine kinase n=1 Tax=Streptomyces sp. ISL-100 TaxID=2819173 RepID=UPI001BE8D24A|nr:nitrate- and nitrite sensing domain-containing protein [Streptomyces sp. ISL-100]MBT2395004.1 nitrate- and nitrite sensing domain-containing protein [Streptomyces sp. ISL-100]
MRKPRRTPGAETPTRSAPPARGRRAHAGPPADENTDAPPGHEPHADTRARPAAAPRERWRLRPRTVRAKIVSLLMVPVVSLLALWAFATVTTAQDVAGQQRLQRVDEEVRIPVTATVAELQAERRAAVRYLASPDDDRADALEQQAKRTDSAADALRLDDEHTVADSAALPDTVATRLRTFVSGTERLTTLRTGVLDRTADWDKTYEQYTRTIQDAFAVTGALTGIQDARPGSEARVLLEFARAGEMLAREDALLSSAQLTRTFDVRRQRQFAGAAQTRRSLTESAVVDLPDAERDAWRALTGKSAYDDVLAAEDKVIAAQPGRKAAQAVTSADWEPAHTAVQRSVRAIVTQADRNAAARTDPLARGVLTPAGAAVLLGLAAVAASLVISVRIGRGLVVELISLRNGALEIARRKLPHAMDRLRAGEEIDIHTEAPPGPPADDEIGQVGEALATVHRAAVSSAVERAELASGVSGIFVNLARRSQVLVHRQLNLLDSMERRADDPGELGDLFRLDHLTTRMRRHAESLIILSGAAPGRAWRMPVPLTNVVRAAVSEIEDYARVEVRHLPEAAVAGSAVADLTHLLAELVENAAQFSPPHTKVRVTGEPVGNGYALEIEDRGLGMGKESLSEANRRIEQSEALDLFDSDRLGLFVVSRLASRHGIKVHLRTSPYGGTTAVVLLPIPLLQSAVTKGEGAPRSAVRAQRQEGPPKSEETAPLSGPALVPGPRPSRTNGTSFAAQAPRPALAAQPPPKERPQQPAGVTALRPHNRTAEPDDRGNDENGLPRRVRQASLVPQLREAPTPPAVPAHPSAAAAQGRTPEQARDRMTAYRSGWTRGREGDHE